MSLTMSPSPPRFTPPPDAGDPSGDEKSAAPKPPPRIDLKCPDCGHVQSEPPRVVSTQCRSCLSHYQVHDGHVVQRSLVQTRFAKPGAHDAEPVRPPEPAAPMSPPRKPVPPPMSWWKRMILRPDPPREVRCFECDRGFIAGATAESTQCPGCGSYVSLRHHDIRQSWTRHLQTRGDVVVHKEGSIQRARVECHHLTVFGKIAGEIDCSGDFDIHGSGKISGTVKCRHLRVRRKARVEFLDPVTAASILIEGEVRGVFHCGGTVTLARRARLHGFVRAASLEIRTGASHVGTVDLVKPQASAT